MEVTIPLASHDEAMALFGLEDRNLKLLRDRLEVTITARGDVVRLQGDQASIASDILQRMLSLHRSGQAIEDDFVEQEFLRRGVASRVAVSGDPIDDAEEAPTRASSSDTFRESDALADSGTSVESDRPPSSRGPRRLSATELQILETLPRTQGQADYVEKMLRHELVFSIGPAGTGKTFLAVNMAVHFLKEGEVRRLILCRPAVEAGEKLGFLPGDLHQKINPYLRPLYDALNDVLGYEQVKRYLERELIEIIPLAYMRGRTLNNAFIILDEGQNTTISQMKMFLTRMGANSRIVVGGDITQVDLPSGQPSGLVHAEKILGQVRGVSWSKLGRGDIVRHPLVQRIVKAYESEGSG